MVAASVTIIIRYQNNSTIFLLFRFTDIVVHLLQVFTVHCFATHSALRCSKLLQEKVMLYQVYNAFLIGLW